MAGMMTIDASCAGIAGNVGVARRRNQQGIRQAGGDLGRKGRGVDVVASAVETDVGQLLSAPPSLKVRTARSLQSLSEKSKVTMAVCPGSRPLWSTVIDTAGAILSSVKVRLDTRLTLPAASASWTDTVCWPLVLNVGTVAVKLDAPSAL